MPDLASRRLARTSWVLLPIDETMPIPVTTTRLMHASSASRCVERALLPPSTSARLHHFVAEQTDLEVHRPIDDRTVRRQPTVGDAEHELAAHDPLEWKFSGQVLPTVKNVVYGIDIKRVMRSKLVLGIADGWLSADGSIIYRAMDLKVGLFRDPAMLQPSA